MNINKANAQKARILVSQDGKHLGYIKANQVLTQDFNQAYPYRIPHLAIKELSKHFPGKTLTLVYRPVDFPNPNC